MGENTEKLKERWHYIDLMEFIGIFFVLMYHSTTYSYFSIGDTSKIAFFRYYLRTILLTCVPIFFFANGYLLLNRSFNLKRHIVKMIKIIFLTVLWAMIVVILSHENLSLRQFISYVWNIEQGGINYLWYMGALICIYVFFPLLKIAFDNNKKVFIYFTVVSAILTLGNTFIGYSISIVLNLLKIHNGLINTNWFNMFNPFRGIYGFAFVYFCVGGLSHQLKGKIEKVNIKKRVALSVLTILLSSLGLFITAILLSNITGQLWEIVWYGYDTIFTFVNTIAIFVLCLSYKGGSKFIRLISVNTLGIYFIHIIFRNLSRQYVVQIPIFTTFIGCAFYAFIIMLVSLIVTKILLKIPILKELVRI